MILEVTTVLKNLVTKWTFELKFGVHVLLSHMPFHVRHEVKGGPAKSTQTTSCAHLDHLAFHQLVQILTYKKSLN